ncbi:MAG: glycoside hydrolase family 172 protein [Chitinophagaceae bacterium]
MSRCFKIKVFSILVVCMSLLSFQQVLAQHSQKASGMISLSTELKPFYKIDDLPVYREKTVIGQTSSYDTTGGNDDGFSGKYSFLRKRTDSSLVIFDMQGPGVINRIWTPTPSEDSLDFYIDDTSHAAFTIKYLDLFSGKIFPFIAPLCNNQLGGYYCYLPIPFQRRCMIVYRGKRTQFHQIGYRLFPAGTAVKNFTLALNAEEKTDLESIKTLWNKRNKTVQDFQSLKSTAISTIRKKFELHPGDKQVLVQTNKGGRILGIELDPSSAFEGLLKEVDIKITWDHEITPAVYCPVADFFGYAFGKTSMESLLIGTTGKKNYCYFPMPFDHSATIELIYRKSSLHKTTGPLVITANVIVSGQVRDSAKEGKFYTFWNSQQNVPLGQPHEFIKVSGKGHNVGTVLQARGLEPGMTTFFEGDDSTAIDGKTSMHGTGSEDYFNGGWYALMDRWDAPFSMPLSGALDYSLPLARTGGYRLFLADKLSFTNNLYQSIEHGPEKNMKPGSYTSVSYYYCNTAPVVSHPPNSAQTQIVIPDTLMIYPQLMSFIIDGEIGVHRRGESFIFTTEHEAGLQVQLQDLPAGNYKLLLDYTKLPQGCTFSLWQRQTPLTGWIDSYSKEISRFRWEYLSEFAITPLNHTITIRLKADNDKKQFYLNRIVLLKGKE